MRFSDVPESARHPSQASPEGAASVRDVPSIGGSPELRGTSSVSGSPWSHRDGRSGSAHRLRKLPPALRVGNSPDSGDLCVQRPSAKAPADADRFFLESPALPGGVASLPDESARIQIPPPVKVRFSNPFAVFRRRPRKLSAPPTPMILPHERARSLYGQMCTRLLEGAKNRQVELKDDLRRQAQCPEWDLPAPPIRTHPVAVGPLFASGLGFVRLSAPEPTFDGQRLVTHGQEFDDPHLALLAPELTYSTPNELERFDVRLQCVDPVTEDVVWVPSPAFNQFVDMFYRLQNDYAPAHNLREVRIALSTWGEHIRVHKHEGTFHEIYSFWIRAACPDVDDVFET